MSEKQRLLPQQQTSSSTGSMFRQRLLGGELLLGTFLKTPSVHATEILAGVGYDFVVVDQEHAPFDMNTLDHLALAAHAGRIASLVRVSDEDPSRLLGVLELGFSGVIVPHVSSATTALAVVQACRFAGGYRSYSNSPRAGAYGGTSMSTHLRESDGSVSVVPMIEDLAGIGALAELLAVEGVDAVLIGRADLAVAMGETAVDAPAVSAQVARVMELCKAANVRVMLHVQNTPEAKRFTDQGASAFIMSSDQALLRMAAANARHSFPPRSQS